MSAHGNNGHTQDASPPTGQNPEDVRDMLRQLASQIKDQIADVDRRHDAALKTMEKRLQPSLPSHDDPWDSASAEALTRLYEGVAPEAPSATPVVPVAAKRPAPTAVAPVSAAKAPAAPAQPIYFADPPVAAPRVQTPVVQPPVVRAAPVAAPAAQPLAAMASLAANTLASNVMAAPAAASLASDRAWLDARLADLQSKVEASLAGFDPAPMLKPVNDRIDAFEDQMLGVLETVAQKADLERFATLETDMTTVKGHVEAARGQLKRLDGIEEQLRALHAFATEAQSAGPATAAAVEPAAAARLEEIEAMLRDLHNYAVDQQSAAAPEMPDFHGLAEKAADRAAANIVEQHMDLFSPSKRAEMHAQAMSQSQANNGLSLDDMQSLFDAYTDEHRREQSQTAATLTTMQEALIRLIDRIEELAGEAPEEAHENAAVAPEAPRFVEVPDERSPVAPGRRQSDKPSASSAAAAQPQTQQAQAQASMPPVQQPNPRQTAPRTSRMSEPAASAAAPEEDAAAAAAALAAERARVMAERSAERGQGRRPPTTRPQVQIAADPSDEPSPETPAQRPRKVKPKSSMSKAQIGIAAALGGALMIGSAYIAYPMFSKKVVETKMDQRVPRASPAVSAPAVTSPAVTSPAGQPTPSPAARPAAGGRSAIPTETLGTPDTTRPTTPALPEANPATRAQPASGTPLPTQPAPTVAPAPQTAPSSRVIETPVAPQRRRTGPETVTDDLSSNTQEPDTAQPSFSQVMGARVTTAAVQGIALDNTGAMDNPSELARRQARLAPAVETAVVESQAEAMARGRTEMPPAQIGPMSLRTSAQQGDPAAAFEVAARYAEAKGVKQDFQQALVWYSRSAQQGFVPAQYRLGTIYEGGLHGTQDLPRAKVWYKRAADQGNVKAMHNLAVLSAGSGQSQPDYQTASKWFSEAADRGLADSQFNLGVLHESGLGVQKDPQQAYKWFALAARSGDKEAVRRRDQLMATFTPQQAQLAEKLVQSWRAKPTDLKANDARAASLAWQEQKGMQAQQAFDKFQQHQAQQAQKSQQQQPAATAPAAAPAAPAAQTATAKQPAAQPLLDALLAPATSRTTASTPQR